MEAKPQQPPTRHCFICLSDDTDDATPQEWVSPCPCTLEGHQECMLSWVASREGDRRPLECPVCKAPIRVSGPWNPVAAVNDYFNVTILSIAPWVLAGTTVGGVYAANFAHGIHSLATFAGPDAARAAVYARWPAAGLGDIRWSAAATVAHLTPAMIILRLMPGLGVKTLPSLGATAIGIYKLANPNFSLRRWPPSPWAALFFVICMRSAYFRLWKTWGFPWERRIDRRLDNLPDDPPAAPERPAARVGMRGAGVLGWILERLVLNLDVDVEDDEARQARRMRRQERRRLREVRALRAAVNRRQAEGEQGVRELMERLDALNVRMDEQFREHLRRMNRRVPGEEVEEPVGIDERGILGQAGNEANQNDNDNDSNQDGDDNNQEANENGNENNQEEEVDEIRIQINFGNADDEDEDDDDNDDDPIQANAPANAAADAVPANDVAGAPANAPADPPRAANVGLTVDRLIIETTITLLFPMICYSFGEALRLTILPRSWTDTRAANTPSSSWAWKSGGGGSATGADGLLSRRWGRSLVGGCVFVVLRDAVRMYAKYSRLRNRSLKRVESVARPRRG